MPQFSRPSSDTTTSSWSNQAGSTVTIFNTIDETVQDNADYITSQLTPTSDLIYAARLSSVEDPLSSANHIVRYAYAKSASGGSTVGIEVELRQDYVSTASLGTSIASWIHTAIVASAVSSAVQTLTAAQADAITAYSSLFLLVRAHTS